MLVRRAIDALCQNLALEVIHQSESVFKKSFKYLSMENDTMA